MASLTVAITGGADPRVLLSGEEEESSHRPDWGLQWAERIQ
jgi:hypothetical protein